MIREYMRQLGVLEREEPDDRMTPPSASSNIVLGTVYTCYGLMTIVDLKRGWRTHGLLPLRLRLAGHGVHLRPPPPRPRPPRPRLGPGRRLARPRRHRRSAFPVGVLWFLLRVEAMMGGRGERTIAGTPRLARPLLPMAGAAYLAAVARRHAARSSRAPTELRAPDRAERLPRRPLRRHRRRARSAPSSATTSVTGDWSVSGLSLGLGDDHLRGDARRVRRLRHRRSLRPRRRTASSSTPSACPPPRTSSGSPTRCPGAGCATGTSRRRRRRPSPEAPAAPRWPDGDARPSSSSTTTRTSACSSPSVLRLAGYEVETAPSGVDALIRLERRAGARPRAPRRADARARRLGHAAGAIRSVERLRRPAGRSSAR